MNGAVHWPGKLEGYEGRSEADDAEGTTDVCHECQG